MMVLGHAPISDLFGGLIAYRSLRPVDPRLRNANVPSPSRDQTAPGRQAPRKGSEQHAIAVAELLGMTHRLLRGRDAPAPSRLLYVGDSAGSDVRAFEHLCRATGWDGQALIVAETPQPAEVHRETISGGSVWFANRWEAVEQFANEVGVAGYGSDGQTIAVVDIDKTLIGARGRNSAPLDRARFQAALDVARLATGGTIDERLLETSLREFDRPAWHHLTADNQDIVAYLALIVATGGMDMDDLRGRHVEALGFPSFLDWVSGREHVLIPGVRQIHESICGEVRQGRATPFVAFRQSEYWATCGMIGGASDEGGAETRLETEIVITGEVWRAAKGWRNCGCTVFGLSDKPDEACFPPDGILGEAALPLHEIPMPIIGGAP